MPAKALGARILARNTGPRQRSRLETIALWAWCLLALGIAIRIGLVERDPRRNNVYLKVFATAGESFLHGRDLYLEADGTPTYFRYPPLSAASFVPFAMCGPRLGSLLWRVLSFGLLFFALQRCFRARFPFAMDSRARGLVLLMVALIGITSLNNGQTNPHILALFLLATVGALAGRTAGPAAALAGCVALKVYPVVYGGVLGALRPRHALTLALSVGVAVALPFLLQSPSYVAAQYGQLWDVLAAEDRTHEGLGNIYRDLRLVAISFGLTIPPLAFQALQVVGGGAIVGICLLLRRAGALPHMVLEYAFSLTMCWLMLLGPATEKATYILMAPSLAWTFVAVSGQGRLGLRRMISVAITLVLLSLLPVDRPQQHSFVPMWCLLPYATVLLTVVLSVRAAGDVRRLWRGEGLAANKAASPKPEIVR